MTPAETLVTLSELYQTDETAWLERMAALAAEGQTATLDLMHLSEYLSDMAKRDKREVLHRLVVLFTHLLKWEHQPEKRSRGWELTIQEQREELQDLLESGTLRNHAEHELSKAYQKAVRRAAVETELEEKAFPAECPYTLDQALEGADNPE
jgi:hypothetical protein